MASIRSPTSREGVFDSAHVREKPKSHKEDGSSSSVSGEVGATGGSGGKFDGSRQGDNNTCVVWPTLESAKSAPTQNTASEARSGEGGEIEIPTYAP